MGTDKGKSFGSQVGHTADVIVGDVILGSVGRAGYHVGKIPGVAQAGRYVKENVSDGYRAAEVAEKKRKAGRALTEALSKGLSMSPEMLRKTAEENGLDPKALDEIVAHAKRVAGKGAAPEAPMPGDGTYSAPAAAGA